MVKDVTKVVSTEMTHANKFVFSLTLWAAASETMTYDLVVIVSRC